MHTSINTSLLARALGPVALAASLVGFSSPDASAASYFNVRSVQYHVDRDQTQIDRAIQTAQQTGATNIFLQEVYLNQALQLIDTYDSTAGGPWTVSATTQRLDSPCGGSLGDGQGFNIVIVTAPGLQKLQYDLDPNEGAGAMACIKYDAAGRTWVTCSAHIPTQALLGGAGGEAKQRTQLETIRSNAAAWNTFGWIVTVGGDSNTKPDETNMNTMYGPNQGGNGPFTEFNRNGSQSSTRDGLWTAESGQDVRRKVDHVFHGLAWTGETYSFGESVPQPRVTSPHRMLLDDARVILP